MQVTSKTKYRDFAVYEQFLIKESVAELKACAEKSIRFCHTLTLDEFFGLLDGNYELLGDLKDPSVFQVYWMMRFKDFVEEVTQSCEALTIKDPSSEGLEAGCVQMTSRENVMVFVRNYFGLPSFSQAGERTIGEYILARKDTFNKWRVRKNSEDKQLKELKKKKK